MRATAAKRIQPIHQSEISECGLACFAMICTSYGRYTPLREIRTEFPSSLRGTSLQALAQIANKYGFQHRAWRIDTSQLATISLPAIAHWDQNHFVVVEKFDWPWVYIVDPAKGQRKVRQVEFDASFAGVVLELVPGSKFERRKRPRTRSGSWLGIWLTGFRPHLANVVFTAFALEATAIAGPWLVQQLVDGKGGASSPNVSIFAIGGLVLLAVANILLGLSRSAISIRVDSISSFSLQRYLYQAIFGKPLDFFFRRHIGDTLSRFGSLGELLRLLSPGSVETALDGLLAVVVFCLMIHFGGAVAALPLAAICGNFMVQARHATDIRQRRFEEATFGNRQTETLIETLRAVETVRLNSLEGTRHARWERDAADALDARRAGEWLAAKTRAIAGALSQLELTAVLGALALALTQGSITLGALMAFLAYRAYFVSRASAVVEKLQEIRLATVHMERINELEDESSPAQAPNGDTGAQWANVGVTATSLSYCFPGSETPLDFGELVLPTSSFTCLSGASGSGKTTLLRLLSGALPPTAGTVSAVTSAGQMPVANCRAVTAAVLQEDFLFTGSIRDNIVVGRAADAQWLDDILQHLGLTDLLAEMPQGLDTQLKESGSSLSGGERQRLLLCRALYGRPRLLFLDEATSQLDADNESRVLALLRSLRLTVIFSSHSRAVRIAADQIVYLPLNLKLSAEKNGAGHAKSVLV